MDSANVIFPRIANKNRAGDSPSHRVLKFLTGNPNMSVAQHVTPNHISRICGMRAPTDPVSIYVSWEKLLRTVQHCTSPPHQLRTPLLGLRCVWLVHTLAQRPRSHSGTHHEAYGEGVTNEGVSGRRNRFILPTTFLGILWQQSRLFSEMISDDWKLNPSIEIYLEQQKHVAEGILKGF
jgi:hypothetical protein